MSRALLRRAARRGRGGGTANAVRRIRVLSWPKPTGIVRVAFRLPVYLYRANLGWLLGHRGLLLTHRGRKSGRVYQTVLEVIRYDPATCESVVLSGGRDPTGTAT